MNAREQSLKSGTVICVAAILAALAGSTARADDRIWDQPAFGTFNFGTSWLGGVAPTFRDRAVFGHTLTTTFNPITCQFLQSTECASLVVESGSYEFLFANPGVNVQLTGDQTGFGSGDIVVGDRLGSFDPGLSPAALLSMSFNGQLTAHGIAVGWGGSGFGSRSSTLNISGLSTRVTTRVGMVVGGAIPNTGKSASIVNISDGATLRTADAGGGNYVNGTVNVTGAGSRWDNNGQLSMGGTASAPAQLNIAGGGHGRVGYIAIIGGDENGPANVSISDTGSLFDVTAGIWLGNGSGAGTGSMTVSNGGRVQVDTDVSVGRGGSAGFLTVESGGQVQSGFAFIGCFQNAPGLARIAGVGSRWDMTGGPVIGRESNGRIEVLGGGAMNCGGDMNLGDFSGVAGDLLVRGSGSTLTSASGTVVVGNAGNGVLTIENQGHGTVAGLLLAAQHGSSGTVVVRSQGRLDVSGGASIGDGSGGNGDAPALGGLLVEGGSQFTTTGSTFMGRFNNSQGAATVRGGGSRLSVGEQLRLGDSGNSRGSLVVEGGARLDVAQDLQVGWMAAGSVNGSSNVSTVTLSDTGTVATIGGQLCVGHGAESRGLVELNPGASLTVGSVVLGYGAGASGAVVSGLANSNLTTLHAVGDTTVGWDGDGGVIMLGQQKRMVVDGTLYVGRGSGTGLVTLGNSDGTSAPHQIGNAGSDSVVLDRGNVNIFGHATSVDVRGHMRIASRDNTNATMVVDGAGDYGSAGMTTIGGSLTVGDRGAGSVLVRNGGVLHANSIGSGDVWVGKYPGSSGSITIERGELRVDRLQVGGYPGSNGTVTFTSDTSVLDYQNCTVNDGCTIDLGAGGRMIGNSGFLEILPGGLLCGSGTIDDVVLNYGTISIGHSAGTLNVLGVGTEPGSLLQFEIGGAVPGTEYDVLNITTPDEGFSVNTFGGTLELFSLNGFVPMPGQSFDIVRADSRAYLSGSFDSIIDHTGYGFTFAVIDSGHVGRLTATVPTPAGSLVFGVGGLLLVRRRRMSGVI